MLPQQGEDGPWFPLRSSLPGCSSAPPRATFVEAVADLETFGDFSTCSFDMRATGSDGGDALYRYAPGAGLKFVSGTPSGVINVATGQVASADHYANLLNRLPDHLLVPEAELPRASAGSALKPQRTNRFEYTVGRIDGRPVVKRSVETTIFDGAGGRDVVGSAKQTQTFGVVDGVVALKSSTVEIEAELDRDAIRTTATLTYSAHDCAP